MLDLTKKLLIISLLAPSFYCHAVDLSNLSNEPLFLSGNARGMLMLILGRDHTLANSAYNDAASLSDSANGISNLDTRFNPSYEYYGYFDPYKCYTYGNNKFSPNDTSITTLASTDCSRAWSGNFLNYVTTSRMDALRKALYGGLRSTDTANSTILELSYVPADGHSWAKSYDPLDARQQISGRDSNGNSITTHAFPISKFSPFDNSDKIFFGRVNIRGGSASTPNLRVLNLKKIKDKGCSKFNDTGFDPLSDSDYQNMRPRHWTGSGTPVTDIFLVKPSDNSICIIDFNGRSNDYSGAVSNYTLRVDSCVTGKINSRNKEGCVLYPSRSYKPTGILHTYKDKADFGLMTGSYDQHLSGGVLRRNIADFNKEINSNDGTFILTNPNNKGSGIVDALNKIKIAKFNMNSGTFDYNKNPWVFWSGDENEPISALNYDSCSPGNFSYGLNTNNSHCHDWGNPIGEMLTEAMRYFYKRSASQTTDFNTNSSVDDSLKINNESWLDPFEDMTLTSNSNKRPYCSPAYNLVISNNNINFDADNIPQLTDVNNNESSWSTAADTIGAKESLHGSKFIIGTLIGSTDKTGAPTAKTLDQLSNVRGSPSEPTKMGSYASAGIAYWANMHNIYANKTKPSRVRTMAIAMAAPIPDINIKMGSGATARNITLVPTAKSVRKWQYTDVNKNSLWDSADAPHSPINHASTSVQPSNEIIGFSVDSISLTSGRFTVSFADMEQGGDYEADMTVTYQYQVTGQNSNTLQIKVISEYASGDIEQHAGYVLSGISPTADGLYLDVRDMPAQGIAGYNTYGIESDTPYYLDTPDENSTPTTARGTSTTLLKPRFESWYFRGTPNNWGKPYGDTKNHSRMVPQAEGNYCTIQTFNESGQSPNQYKISNKSDPNNWDNGTFIAPQNQNIESGKTYKICIHTDPGNRTAWATETTRGSVLSFALLEDDRSVTRTFTLGDSPDTQFLKPPLWYAAKWGSFNSTPNKLASDTTDAPDLTDPERTPSGYYPVTAPGDLEQQLNSVFSSKLSDDSYTGSAIATSSYRLISNSIQFTSQFVQANWTGNLLAKAIDSSGTVGSTLWDAATILDAQSHSSRVIFSYNPSASPAVATLFSSPSAVTGDTGGISQAQINNLLADSGKSGESNTNKLTFIQKLINYLRGERTNEGTLFRKRTHVLGDIVHSTPTYGMSITDTRPFVIVGANDGMVHVFDAHRTTASGGGSEIFAYVPSQSLRASSDASIPESLAAYAKMDYQSKHRYYVDGDISLATIDNNKRMAFGALGQGGRGIYALDLTDLSSVSTDSASSRVKWEFSHANMGFNRAAPAVVDVKIGTDKTRVVIFSNGFNAPALSSVGSCGAYPCGTLFILNAQTGALLATLTTTVMSGLSEPAVVDKDRDGYADTIYAGDLQGNLWRFDISSSDKTAWSNGTKIFRALASDGTTPQPITTRPSVGSHSSGGVMVYFGTGKYLESTDTTASNQTARQSLYGLWDNPQNTAEILRSNLLAQTVTESGNSRFIANNATAINWSTHRGWYFDLPTTGERIITNTDLAYNKLNLTTMIPGGSTDDCEGGGTGWLMQVNADTGLAWNQGDDAAKATSNIKLGGISTHFNNTLVLNNGSLEDLSTTQDHKQAQTPVKNPGAKVGPLTWKQLY